MFWIMVDPCEAAILKSAVLKLSPKFFMECGGADTFCRRKEKHIQDKYLRFFETINDCVQDIKPNAILLSSVLQYLRDPGKIIDTLIKIGSDVILIDRTIVNSNSVNNIYIQHVPSTIYSASYPCYSLSESWLLNRFGKTYDMAEDFTSLDFPALRNINSEFKGYIFKKMA